MRRAALGLALALAACGGTDSKGVAVSEAPDVGARADLRPSALDTTYADSGLYDDPRLDSLRADALRRDSLRADSLAQAARPDFRAFFPRFRAAAWTGPDAVATLATASVDPDLLAAALAPPFRSGVLALTARDFVRDGTARTASVIVGFDVEGRVVPEDEAETESSAFLRFDVVDGAYRLVSVDLAG